MPSARPTMPARRWIGPAALVVALAAAAVIVGVLWDMDVDTTEWDDWLAVPAGVVFAAAIGVYGRWCRARKAGDEVAAMNAWRLLHRRHSSA